MIDKIIQLEKRKEAGIEVFTKLEERLASGRITKEQYEDYILRTFGGRRKEQFIEDINKKIEAIKNKTTRIRIELTTGFILLLILSMFFLTINQREERITGFIVFNKTTNHTLSLNQTITEDTIITLNETNISSMRITASHIISGDTEIYLEDSTKSLKLYE